MVNKAEAQRVHENQGRGNGTNRSTVDGRTTKDQFTRHLKSCPNVIRRFRSKVNTCVKSLRVFGSNVQFLLTKLAIHQKFLLGITLGFAAAGRCNR
ncbi:hypothetical protein BN2475_90063 [Paraburkholderia ribeironis]|uniref:Uncharacterized protein n=1 Tax=Paraburkholderia ribeironis TaxID=1247936 RepID=A0A1N7RN40_9BURK|nr:hypothetical protein BN2475_90063 [Paraburkholderia ribeironis]